MNIRYFELNEETRWFGGGIDLTPHYVFENDARFFHHKLKQACDDFGAEFYPKFKIHADDYFLLNTVKKRVVLAVFLRSLKT